MERPCSPESQESTELRREAAARCAISCYALLKPLVIADVRGACGVTFADAEDAVHEAALRLTRRYVAANAVMDPATVPPDTHEYARNLWSRTARRIALDGIKRLRRQEVLTEAPRPGTRAGGDDDRTLDRNYVRELLAEMPHFFEQVRQTCSTAERETMDELDREARGAGFESAEETFVFFHAFFERRSDLFGCPPDREVRLRLCRNLGLQPSTLFVRVTRLRKRWDDARRRVWHGG